MYTGGRQEDRLAIWRIALDSGATPEPVVQTGFDNGGGSLSPDGKWLAYVSNETGRDEVYVRPYPGPGGRWQVSLEGGGEPLWTREGSEIIYRASNGNQVVSAPVRTRPGFEVTGRSTVFTGDYLPAYFRDHNYAVSRDGRTFVMVRSAQSTNQSVTVMLHWFDQIRGQP
jgi:serine/threonine-protein kinase